MKIKKRGLGSVSNVFYLDEYMLICREIVGIFNDFCENYAKNSGIEIDSEIRNKKDEDLCRKYQDLHHVKYAYETKNI